MAVLPLSSFRLVLGSEQQQLQCSWGGCVTQQMGVTQSSQVTAAPPVPGSWCSSTKCDHGCYSLPWGWREVAASTEQVSTGPASNLLRWFLAWMPANNPRERRLQGASGGLCSTSAEGGGLACATKTALFCLLSLRWGWLFLPCVTYLSPGAETQLLQPAGESCHRPD